MAWLPCGTDKKRRAEKDPTVAIRMSKKRGRATLLEADLDKKVQTKLKSGNEVMLSPVDLSLLPLEIILF